MSPHLIATRKRRAQQSRRRMAERGVLTHREQQRAKQGHPTGGNRDKQPS